MKHTLLLGLLVLVLAAAIWWFLGDHPENGGLDAARYDGRDTAAPGDPLEGEGASGRSQVPAEAPREGPRTPVDVRAIAPVTVRGRVVDERRRPVARAEVEVRLGGRRRGGGLSDAEGAFAVPVGALDARDGPAGLVRASAPGPRTGLAPFWTTTRMRDEIMAGVVVVAPTHDLRVRVAHEGRGVGGARVVVAQRAGGAPQPLEGGVTSSDGSLTVRGLPSGVVEVFAAAPGAGRGRARASLPQAEGPPATVELHGERRLEVLVLDAATRRPVAGAELSVGDHASLPAPTGPGLLPPLGALRTDRQGRAAVRGLGAQQTVLVSARASGYLLAPWYEDPTRTVRPETGEVRIGLRRYRTVRFPIAPGGAEPPPEGTRLRIEMDGVGTRDASPGVAGAMEDGLLVVRGLPSNTTRGVALAPGDLQAAFAAERDVEIGPAVRFRASRTVVVRVTSPSGEAVPGVRLRLNPMETSAHIEPALSDAQGLARFPGVGCDRVGVFTASADQPSAGLPLATLDLTEERAVYEVELPAVVQVVLHVRVEGEARLPGAYTLMAGARRVPPEAIDEDPAAGTLRASVFVPEPELGLLLRLVAPSFLPAEANVPAGAVGETLEFDLALRAAGALHVRVVPPEDGAYVVNLQRFDDDEQVWKAARAPGAAGLPPARQGLPDGGTRRFEGLEPGRYRAIDARTGVASEAVEVRLGGPPAEVGLDLSGATWIEGRVLAPPGANLRHARVLVEGRDDLQGLWTGVHPDASGAFKLRAVAGRALAVTVRHPRLAPARRGGRVTARPGGGPIELRLERGAEARFRIFGLERTHTPASGIWYGPVRVLLFRGEPTGAPLITLQPLADGGTFYFGGYEPGTYTLWITHGSERAPITLEDVALGEGSTDLGTLTPSEGASIRVRLAGGRRRALPNLWMDVVRVEEPSYRRHAALQPEEDEIVCRGLGPGRFRVTVRAAAPQVGAAQARVVLEREVTVDGSAEAVLDLELK